MTPFPEAEIMTIKRLEVALRKMDFKLLKDGAYKLHEKYHGGHQFEYLDLLKEIFFEVSENSQIPSEIKDILCPTIEDILIENDVNLAYDTPEENVVATYSSNEVQEEITEHQQETKPEPTVENNEIAPKIDAFSAFGSQKQEQTPRYFTNSPFSAQPFKDFHSTPYQQPTNAPIQNPTIVEPTTEVPLREIYQEKVEENSYENETKTEEFFEQNKPIEQNEPSEKPTIAQETPKKTMAIFYGQDSSEDKIKNIKKLQKAISENLSAQEIMKLISEITLQADTNVIELQGVLEQLKSKNYAGVNLITNSQSAMFSQLFNISEIKYDLFEDEGADINFQPLYGVSNLFVCKDCEEKYFDIKLGIKPLVLQCPKCKNVMYPDFYAQEQGEKINLEYYNSALSTLANSEVWLLIHPSFNDKTSADLIETAFKVSSKVKEVYVLDKDINVRETYKYIFSKINPDVKVNVQNNALEDYLSII